MKFSGTFRRKNSHVSKKKFSRSREKIRAFRRKNSHMPEKKFSRSNFFSGTFQKFLRHVRIFSPERYSEFPRTFLGNLPNVSSENSRMFHRAQAFLVLQLLYHIYTASAAKAASMMPISVLCCIGAIHIS